MFVYLLHRVFGRRTTETEHGRGGRNHWVLFSFVHCGFDLEIEFISLGVILTVGILRSPLLRRRMTFKSCRRNKPKGEKLALMSLSYINVKAFLVIRGMPKKKPSHDKSDLAACEQTTNRGAYPTE
jgi:hypothetical protein